MKTLPWAGAGTVSAVPDEAAPAPSLPAGPIRLEIFTDEKTCPETDASPRVPSHKNKNKHFKPYLKPCLWETLTSATQMAPVDMFTI